MSGQAERIAVIGCSGAGKSTLARALAAATGLPLIHLDREFWQPGWTEPDKAAFAAHVEALIAADRWVIDGQFTGTLERRLARATLVIWLDLPTWHCLAGVVARVRREHGRVRADMGEGCPEKWDLAFLHYVWRFRRRVRPRIVAALAGVRAPVVRLATVDERRRFVAGLGDLAPDGQTVARLASSRIEMP